MNRIIKAILYPIVRERLAERMQLELNRSHQRSFGWCVTRHEEIGCPRGVCPDLDEQSMINRAWRAKR